MTGKGSNVEERRPPLRKERRKQGATKNGAMIRKGGYAPFRALSDQIEPFDWDDIAS